MNNLPNFEKLPNVDDLSGVIEDMFEVKLDISGGWGYDNNSAVIVHSIDITIDQFLFLFAKIRTTTQMNLILDKADRYAGIELNFIEGKQIEIEDKLYDMITFEITAMKEDKYLQLLQEYETNYGKNDNFDLDDHLKKCEEHTITLQSDFWFYGLENYCEKN